MEGKTQRGSVIIQVLPSIVEFPRLASDLSPRTVLSCSFATSSLGAINQPVIGLLFPPMTVNGTRSIVSCDRLLLLVNIINVLRFIRSDSATHSGIYPDDDDEYVSLSPPGRRLMAF